MDNNNTDIFANIFEGDTAQESPVKDQTEAKTDTISKEEDKPEAVTVKPEAADRGEDMEAEKSEKQDIKPDFETLRKRLDESKAWGHKSNMAFINSRRKMTEFLNRLHEEGAIFDDQLQSALGIFNTASEIIPTEDDENQGNDGENMFVRIKNNLDQEFNMFKKYNKVESAEEKYNSFFAFWSLFSNQEKENLLDYFQEEKPEIVFDEVMRVGTELHDTLYKGMQKKGGLVPYVKSLQEKNNKLQEELKKLQSELENTTEKVYNRPIGSRASATGGNNKYGSYADIWQGS